MDDLGWSDELSDLTNSEDDSDALAMPVERTTRTSARPPKPIYVVREQLKPYRNTQYTVESLYQQLVKGRINVCPDYQRDVVWPDTKQSYLIDSILRNLLTTPVIFCVKSNADGTKTRICIDGKQRLTSIRRFLDAEIPYKDSFTDEKLWSKLPDGKVMHRKVLSDAIIQNFLETQIVCFEYDGITEDQEREIFQRVQLGVPLTPAERMQAINGEWPSFVRSIGALVTRDAQGLNTERGRDFQSIAVVVVLAERYQKASERCQRAGAWPGPASLEKMLERNIPVPTRLRAGMREAASALVLLANSPAGKCLRLPERLIPVEFVTTLLLVFVLRGKLGLTGLGAAVAKLRARVRGRFKASERKCNSHVLRFAHKLILELGQEVPRDVVGSAEVPVAKLLAKAGLTEARDVSDAGPSAQLQTKLTPKSQHECPAEELSGDEADSEDNHLKSSPLRQTSTASEHKSSVMNGGKAVHVGCMDVMDASEHLKAPSAVQEKVQMTGKGKRKRLDVDDADGNDRQSQMMKQSPKRAVKPVAPAVAGFVACSPTAKQAPAATEAVVLASPTTSTSAHIIGPSMDPPASRGGQRSATKPIVQIGQTPESCTSSAAGSSTAGHPVIASVRSLQQPANPVTSVHRGAASAAHVTPPARPPKPTGADHSLIRPSTSSSLSIPVSQALDLRGRPLPPSLSSGPVTKDDGAAPLSAASTSVFAPASSSASIASTEPTTREGWLEAVFGSRWQPSGPGIVGGPTAAPIVPRSTPQGAAQMPAPMTLSAATESLTVVPQIVQGHAPWSANELLSRSLSQLQMRTDFHVGFATGIPPKPKRDDHQQAQVHSSTSMLTRARARPTASTAGSLSTARASAGVDEASLSSSRVGALPAPVRSAASRYATRSAKTSAPARPAS